MGFAGILIQQEGVCATFGAGLSSSCVVHLGGDRTTISCVEEGLIITESRMALNYGGRDVSRFFMQLLAKANFPPPNFDIDKRLADYWLAEQLKEKLCTLDASQLGLIISDFHLRLPKQKTKKYALRTYDEIIIAPMALFTPRVFAIDSIKQRLTSKGSISGSNQNIPANGVEEDVEEGDGNATIGTGATVPTTTAMTLCVRHLLPPPPPPPAPPAPQALQTTTSEAATAAPSAQGTPATAPTTISAKPVEAMVLEPISLSEVRAQSSNSKPGTPGNMTPAIRDEDSSMASERTSPAPNKNGHINGSKPAAPAPATPSVPTIDVPWEASKVPLDFAVWNSIQASISNLGSAGTSEERIRKMTSNIICTGGTALIPGIGIALEARLNNYVAQWYTNQGKDPNSSNGPSATVVPPPRDMDPRILAWKGLSVLARLDSAQEMWIPKREWQMFGTRALKEKSLFL
jgi:actin-related protein 8